MNMSITDIILFIPPLLLALTFHEFAHGYIAYKLGDPTAKDANRLTLNPIHHLDPIGTLAFFIFHIGWAKPVPVNPVYFKNPKKDMLWVALAGPMTNLCLAVICAIAYKMNLAFATTMADTAAISTVFKPLAQMLANAVEINLVLCIFNFLPIPPLDGSRILTGLLPNNLARSYLQVERYGFILILVLALSGVLSKLIFPIIKFAYNLLLS